MSNLRSPQMLPPDPELSSTPLSVWPLPPHVQQALLSGLWQRPVTSRTVVTAAERYLEYYRAQCSRFLPAAASASATLVSLAGASRTSITSSSGRPLTAASSVSKASGSSRPSTAASRHAQIAVQTHGDIVAVASWLAAGLSRQDVAERIRTRLHQNPGTQQQLGLGGLRAGMPAWSAPVDAKAVERTIDLVVSLLLMVEVGAHDFMARGGRSSRVPLYWALDGSLHEFARSGNLFAPPEKPLELGGMSPGLEKGFNARSLVRVAGINIRWTTDLAEHLRLADDDRTVFVFHVAGFLQLQRSLGSDMFPEWFVDETVRTLALLFPQNDRATQRWVRSQVRHYGIDPHVGRCGSLTVADRRFDRFLYWHDRLVILKQAYDEARPRSLTQIWADRRNLGQWRLFWLAVVILFCVVLFGILGRIEAAIQIKIAKKMIHVISKGTEGPR